MYANPLNFIVDMSILLLIAKMSWRIIHGKPYFYETVYQNDVRTKRCWTLCHAGLKASARVAQRQDEQQREIAGLRAAQARVAHIDRLISTLDARIRKTLAAHMSQSGYFYLRGQWRNRQESKMQTQPNLTELKDEIIKREEIKPVTSQECEQLSGDIRRLALESLRQFAANQASNQEDASDAQPRVKLCCNVEQTIAEMEAKVLSMRHDFQYELVNSFDRLLVDQLTTAWVQWYVAGWLNDGVFTTSRSLRQNQFYAQRYQQCHSRLTRTIDQLARIRQIPASALRLETQADKDAKDEAERRRNAEREAKLLAHEFEADEK
jgi:hypothetical protein